MKYPARYIAETMREQSLLEHSSNVSEGCARRMSLLGLESLGRLTGLIHDAGKLSEDFIEYLRGGEKARRGTVKHSCVGAEYIYNTFYKNSEEPYERLAAQLIIDSVYCHHGIMFDCINLKGENNFENKMKENSDCGYAELMNVFFREIRSEEAVRELFSQACREVRDFFPALRVFGSFGTGMLQRLLFSALIDADRYDAFCFEADIEPDFSDKAPDWESAAESLERTVSGFGAANTEINKARNLISEGCLNAAAREDGIYTLSVPTGSGKTLSSLRFALNFAKSRNKKHIIYVIPYTTILDQTAPQVREICGDDMVLEHHSGVVIEDEDTERSYRLLSQRWDSPIILTTVVQLMNTLYCGKSACVRRMNALCDSVIIIDEVQSVPRRLVCLFTEAMNFLHEACKSTVLLCTATQPSFDRLKKYPLRLSENSELAGGIPNLSSVFKRNRAVNLYSPKGMSLAKIASLAEEQLQSENSVLVIMNKVGEAKEIYSLLGGDFEKIYLSSKKCGAHRKRLIDYIKERTAVLASGKVETAKKLIVVSTQIVEAGVDFSCGCAIRAAAGIDSFVQAAGRCNRNGEIDRLCNVLMVNVADEKLSSLKDIQSAQRCTKAVLSRDKSIDLLGKEAIKLYYSEYFKADDSSLNEMEYIVGKTSIMEMLSYNSKYVIEYLRSDPCAKKPSLCQAFETAGKNFRAIESETTAVIVPYGKGKDYIKILSGGADLRTKYDTIKKCGKYSVNLYPNEMEKLKNVLCFIKDVGVRVLSDESFYDEEYGLLTDKELPTLTH